MALSRDNGVKEGAFAGNSHIFSKHVDKGLANMVKGLLRSQAAVRLDAEGITALTDSSGGTAGGTLALVTVPVEVDVSAGTTGVLPSSFDTSTLTVENAYSALTQQANLILAEISGGSVATGGGTATLPTIAVIDATVANNTGVTDALSFDSSTAIFGQLLDNQATIKQLVDLCRTAVGLAATTQAAGAGTAQGEVLPGLDVGAVDAGAADDDAVNAVLATAVDTQLAILADNIAEFADQLDEVTNITEATLVKPSHYAS